MRDSGKHIKLLPLAECLDPPHDVAHPGRVFDPPLFPANSSTAIDQIIEQQSSLTKLLDLNTFPQSFAQLAN